MATATAEKTTAQKTARKRPARKPPLTLEQMMVPLVKETPFVRLCVYGRPGVGKTTLGGSDENVCFVAPEDDGTVSAFMAGSTAQRIEVATWDDLRKAHRALKASARETGRVPLNWVVIDSLTVMQDFAQEDILGRAISGDESRDPDLLEWTEFNKFYTMFLKMIKLYNTLPVNILYTAGIRSETDEEGEEFLCPDIRGKGYQLAMKAMALMTSYGAMQVKRRRIGPKEDKKYEEFRRITWKDTGIISGKDRTRVLRPWTDFTEEQEPIMLQTLREKINNRADAILAVQNKQKVEA